MSIVVEHEKRRKEILERALDVFVEEGFDDATFQKIADRCGITRTTLYLYFKNKQEIFNWSIKQFLSSVEEELIKLRKNPALTASEKLIQIMSILLDRLQENQRLISVILNYLLHIAKSGVDVDYRVKKRTVRLRHILATIIIDGIKKGEIKQVNVHAVDELLYGAIESTIFRIAVLHRTSIEELKYSVTSFITLLVP